jgi:hypothetical protein
VTSLDDLAFEEAARKRAAIKPMTRWMPERFFKRDVRRSSARAARAGILLAGFSRREAVRASEWYARELRPFD